MEFKDLLIILIQIVPSLLCVLIVINEAKGEERKLLSKVAQIVFFINIICAAFV